MKSACKNTESGIAFWVICSNWFSCTNLNTLQTALLSVGRILTTGEEQPRSSAHLAGKAYPSPEEAPRPSPGWTRRGRAAAAALPPGSGPRSPRMALEPAKPEGSEGKSGLPKPPLPSTTPKEPGLGHPPLPAAGRSFPASWCLPSPRNWQGFVFLSPFFTSTPSSHNTPQLPTPPFSRSSPLRCPTLASGFEGQTRIPVLWAEVFLLATIRGSCRSRPDQAELPSEAGCAGSCGARWLAGVVSEGKRRTWQWQETRRRETEDNWGGRERTEEWKNVVRAKGTTAGDWAGGETQREEKCWVGEAA